jgi:hypothetical protein
MAFMFQKLEVYRKAIAFADEVAALTQEFPRGYYLLFLERSTESSGTLDCDRSDGRQRPVFQAGSQELFHDRQGLRTRMRAFTGGCVPPRPDRRIEARVLAPRRGDDRQDDQRPDQRPGQARLACGERAGEQWIRGAGEEPISTLMGEANAAGRSFAASTRVLPR